MRFQSTESSCGAQALCNAVRLLRTEELLEDWVIDVAGTDGVDGTSPKGLIRAARIAGLAMRKLRKSQFPSGVTSPMVIAVDNDTHWLVCQRMASGRYLVVDSAAVKNVGFTMTEGELSARACCGKNKKPFTCLVITEATEGPKPRVVYKLEVPKEV